MIFLQPGKQQGQPGQCWASFYHACLPYCLLAMKLRGRTCFGYCSIDDHCHCTVSPTTQGSWKMRLADLEEWPWCVLWNVYEDFKYCSRQSHGTPYDTQNRAVKLTTPARALGMERRPSQVFDSPIRCQYSQATQSCSWWCLNSRSLNDLFLTYSYHSASHERTVIPSLISSWRDTWFWRSPYLLNLENN